MKLGEESQKLLDIIRVTGGRTNSSSINLNRYSYLTGYSVDCCKELFKGLAQDNLLLVADGSSLCGVSEKGLKFLSDKETLVAYHKQWKALQEGHKMTEKKEEKQKNAPVKKAAKKPAAKKAPAKKTAAKKPAAKKAPAQKAPAKKAPAKKAVAKKTPAKKAAAKEKRNDVAYPRETSQAYTVWKIIDKMKGRKKTCPQPKDIVAAVKKAAPKLKPASVNVYIHMYKRYYGF